MTKQAAHAFDPVAEVRGRLRTRPGYHPYWHSSSIVLDEPLWSIAFCLSGDKWTNWYYTATLDLDDALVEARRYFRAPKHARVSLLPVVPRSDTYRKLKGCLLDLMSQHVGEGSAYEGLFEAWLALQAAQEQNLPPPDFHFVSENGVTTWGHGGKWPQWHSCTDD